MVVRIRSLVKDQIEKTPQATKNAFVLEASKMFVGNYLLRSKDDPSKTLCFEELVLVLDQCKDMASPNIRYKVVTFRYLKRYGVIDSITKLRGLNNLVFVQKNMFPGQGAELDMVFMFKMSEVGPRSGVDFVKRMQPKGDLKNA